MAGAACHPMEPTDLARVVKAVALDLQMLIDADRPVRVELLVANGDIFSVPATELRTY